MKKIKVIIVDDSAFIRNILTEIINSDPELEVVATAHDPYDARQKIKLFSPDVITLDIEMPKMDGISFLEKIMKLRPMAVIMVSTLTQKGAEVTLKALDIGAFDYVEKVPDLSSINNIAKDLIEKIKLASKVNYQAKLSVNTASETKLSVNHKFKDIIIALGSSTGGIEAVREIICKLPANFPPILITQHLPKAFTKSFAERLNNISQMNVHEATHDQIIEVGNVYIAPGDKHLEIKSKLNNYVCSLNSKDAVSGHRPSVDVLFSSFAKSLTTKKSMGVILTGMGRDGAQGMLEMKNAGSYNIGQDEDSCVVYGMPKVAFMNGSVDIQVPLNHIAEKLIKIASIGHIHE